MTLSKLKTLTGEIHITVDGVQKSADVDLSTITSFLNAAVVIEKALKDVSVNYNSLTKQFKISSVGANADDTSISFASGTLAQALCLNEEAGAHISSGVGAVSAEALFKTILASNMNWYSFTTLFECTKEQHLDLSAWVTSQNHRYNYVAWTTECNALIADNQSTLLYELEKIHNYSDVTPLYVKEMNKAANVLGYYASLDFNRERGRVPLHYRALDGMKADVTSNADYDGLTSNGYNFYGAYAANADSYSIWQSGRVLGDHMWADAHAAQVWLNANLQKVTVTTLMQNLTIPYNNIGRELFAAPLIGVMEKFKLWGGCNAGTDLDEIQKLAINQITGFDITPTLYAKGYYIYIGPFTASMRAQRSSPSIFAIYTDGGAFRTIEIDSIEVQ